MSNYLEKILFQCHNITINSTCNCLGLSPDFRGEKPMTNRPSHGTPSPSLNILKDVRFYEKRMLMRDMINKITFYANNLILTNLLFMLWIWVTKLSEHCFLSLIHFEYGDWNVGQNIGRSWKKMLLQTWKRKTEGCKKQYRLGSPNLSQNIIYGYSVYTPAPLPCS